MKHTHKIALTAALCAVAIGTSSALAMPAQASSVLDERRAEFARQLTERFGLDETQVTAFLQEQHEARKTEREARHKERLSQAVEAQVLTHEQADALTQYRNNAQNERAQGREAFETWAQQQGIDLEALHEFMHEGQPAGRRGHKKL